LGLCKKKKNFSREEIGTKWIWTALDTTTRLIVCYLIGDRTLEDARLFLRDLTSRTQQLPLFTSDELPHYADGLKELFHKSVKPKPTGRRGRPRKPEKIVDKSLDYAMVHKMWPCGESRGSGSFRLGRTYRRQAGTIAKQDDQHVLRGTIESQLANVGCSSDTQKPYVRKVDSLAQGEVLHFCCVLQLHTSSRNTESQERQEVLA
jgi:IS1 family transposase